jgi:hypothetical protein
VIHEDGGEGVTLLGKEYVAEKTSSVTTTLLPLPVLSVFPCSVVDARLCTWFRIQCCVRGKSTEYRIRMTSSARVVG